MLKLDTLKYLSLTFGFYLALYFQSIYPIFISIFFCNRKLENIDWIIIFFSLFFVLPIVVVDFYSAIQLAIYIVYLIVISLNFNRLDQALKYFSWITLVFLLYTLTLDSININSGRYWKVLPNGYELNPNFLGLIAALGFIYFIKYGNKLISIPFIIFMMICQSRSAILLAILFLVFTSEISFLSIFSLIFSLIVGYGLIEYFGFLSRFTEEGNNGRFDRYWDYIDAFFSHFPSIISSSEMLHYKDIYGNLDNLYLNLILRFGFGGIFFVFIVFYKAFNNHISKEKQAMLFAIMIHGLLEPGFFGTYFLLTLTAISISKSWSNNNL